MSKKTNESNRPTHAIYMVNGEGEKARWTRVGAAWLHNDKKGANLKFEAMPMTGRIVVREIDDANASDEANGANAGGAE